MLVLALMFFSFLFSEKIERFLGMNITLAKNEVLEETLTDSDYSVNYLDVGQGNCSVVYLPDGKVAVIDGGDEMYGKKIHEFLQEKNILKIDFLIDAIITKKNPKVRISAGVLDLRNPVS